MSSNQSDLDQESYLELMQESARTGKSVQEILKERNKKKKSKDKDKDKEEKTPEEKRKQVREFLGRNRLQLSAKNE